jgi:hypothetical protein
VVTIFAGSRPVVVPLRGLALTYYAQEEFGRLAREFDTKARELEAHSEPRWSVGSSFRQQLRGFAGDH